MPDQVEVRIGDRPIGREHPPFVIAEMSGNHNHSLERAMSIVDAAADAGAHAIKLQTYTPDTMTLDLDEREFHISDPKSAWSGTSLYDLYGEAYTPWEWHEPLFSRARERGMMAFSTPFDDTAVEFLETLETPCYKIASFENTDLPLIRRVARTGKPIIISTGMASAQELEEAVAVAREAGCRGLVLLKCTSTYPATPQDSNIRTIPDLRERFQCEVGLSDHTMGVGVAVASVTLGATVIEKHFTLRRADGGVDSAFSLEPSELSALVVETERAWQALGRVSYGVLDSEQSSMQFRRSLYIVKDLPAGTRLTRDDVRSIRPGFGLPTKHLDEVIGRTLRRDVKRGTALAWELLQQGGS
ncbi:MAG TPA: pseudaminic acid synthase [Gemmatimonadaceae bacterium]|nr:pseudaminic acid synthase [Gemmatimonadaceae bacterium]